MKKPKIKVNVTYTPGYEQRFTQACIEAVIAHKAKRRQKEQTA